MSEQLGTQPGGVQLGTTPGGAGGGGGGGVTSVTATSPIVSSGGATPNITHATSGVSASTVTNATVTVDNKGHVTAASSGTAPVTSVTGTAPITSSGGATPAIGVNNTGTTAGRAGLEVLLDDQTVSAQSTITSASFAANGYSELRYVFQGSASAGGTYLRLQINAASGAIYTDMLRHSDVADPYVVQDNSNHGINGYARVGYISLTAAAVVAKGELFPLKVASGGRIGFSSLFIIPSSHATLPYGDNGFFSWDDSSTDITFLTFLTGNATTLTGRFRLWGIPA